MFDIIVCGSATVDVFARTEAETISISGQHNGKQIDEKLLAYPLGSKILIDNLEFHIGGGGTNVLATFSKQDITTAYIGKIGRDDSGRQVFDWLQANNIVFLGQTGGKTGYSIVLDSTASDRTILTYRGSNSEITFIDLPQHKLQTKWFYGSSMTGQSFDTLKKLFVFMKHHGTKTALNPSNYVVQKGLSHVKELLNGLTVLLLNKEEAQLLVGHDEPKYLLNKLLREGPEIVVITDGAEGIYVGSNKHNTSDQTPRFHVATNPHIKVLETTGAGDAFGSGFISELMRQGTLEDAAITGMINAESVIQGYGTKEKTLSKIALNKQLVLSKKNHHHKITYLD